MPTDTNTRGDGKRPKAPQGESPEGPRKPTCIEGKMPEGPPEGNRRKAPHTYTRTGENALRPPQREIARKPIKHAYKGRCRKPPQREIARRPLTQTFV